MMYKDEYGKIKIDEEKYKRVKKEQRKERQKALKLAIKNGISKDMFFTRLRTGWDIKEASTFSPFMKTAKSRTSYIKLAKRKGITADKFYERLAKGWDERKAATKIIRGGNDLEKYIEMAKGNGISLNVFYARLNIRDWNPEKAATTPVGKRGGYRVRS